MAVVKRCELDMIGFDVGIDPAMQGQMSLRWRKLTYDNGELVASSYHRALIDVDTDLDTALEAISSHLEQMGYEPPPASDRSYIDAVTSLAWTPEVKAAVAADRKQKREAAEAEAAREAEALAAEAKARQDQFDAAVAASIAKLGKNKP
jgi:hypothetical protein